MSKPKIGWQKYGEEEEYSYTEEETEEQISMIPLSSKMLDDIAMLNNFECWMGHTNFDITPEIKDKLNKIRGIELLKICSRYRFFVGIGRMFNFKDVRKVIDEEITSQEE